MSRIGKKIIPLPDKVQVTESGGVLSVKGQKGQLQVALPDGITHSLADNMLSFSRIGDTKSLKSLHGLTRALANNAIVGVSTGYSKTLLIEGVGFRAEMKGKRLLLTLGFSHPIIVIPPDGIEFKAPNVTTIIVEGRDKQLLGEVATNIRKLRKPEPYKGKGIRYEGEQIRRKAGKSAAK